MDFSISNAFKSIQPVSMESVKQRTNSIVFNARTGLLICLSSEGKLLYEFSKNRSTASDDLSKCQVLPLMDVRGESILYDEFSKYKFTNIEFSSDASSLLLWSNSSVGIITMNLAFQQNYNFKSILEKDKNTPNSTFSLIVSSLTSPMSSSIVKVSFHPSSSHHIVILYERGLVAVADIITGKLFKIPFSREYCFVSFCFGPSIDWMVSSIFLLSKNGDIYALCPILPYGVQLSDRIIEDMYVWLEEQREIADNGVDISGMSQYIYYAKEYLMSALSSASLSNEQSNVINNDESLSSTMVNSITIPDESRMYLNRYNQPVLAGETTWDTIPIRTITDMLTLPSSNSNSSPWNSSEENTYDKNSSNYNSKIPMLQGPLRVQRRTGRIAVDICIPNSNNSTATTTSDSTSDNSAVPVLIVSFANGDIESYMIGASPSHTTVMNETADSSLQSLGPSWLPFINADEFNQSNSSNMTSYPCPSLLLIETINMAVLLTNHKTKLSSSTATSLSWYLTPDILHNTCLHVTCIEECASFIISLKWLEKLLERQRIALIDHIDELDEYNNENRNDDDDDNDDDGEYDNNDHYYNSNNLNSSFLDNSACNNSLSFINSGSKNKYSPKIKDAPYYPKNKPNSFQSFTPNRTSPSPQRRSQNYGTNNMQDDLMMNNYDIEGSGLIGTPESSRIIPVFCPQLTTTTSTSSMSNVPVNTNGSHTSLSGMSVGYDSMRGHYGLFQTNSGLIAFINLFAHIQFCDSQMSLQDRVLTLTGTGSMTTAVGNKSGSSGLDMKIAQKQQILHEETLVQLFTNVLSGLSKVPVSTSVAAMKVTDVNDTTSPAVLAVNRADAYFEKEVSLPLHEIKQRLDYRVASLKDIYTIQTELLSEKGLQSKIDKFQVEREGLLNRIDNIRMKADEQRDRMQNVLEMISILRSKVTPAERNYHQALRSCSQKTVQLEAKLMALQKLSEQTKQIESPSVKRNNTTDIDNSITSTTATGVRTEISANDNVASPVSNKTMMTTSTIKTNNSFLNKPKPFVFASPLVKQTVTASVNSDTKKDTYNPTATATVTQARPSFKKNTVDLNIQTPKRGLNAFSAMKPPNSGGVSVQYVTEDDQEQCLKLQNAQTEMLQAGIAEIKELESKLALLKRQLATS